MQLIVTTLLVWCAVSVLIGLALGRVLSTHTEELPTSTAGPQAPSSPRSDETPTFASR